MTLRTALAPAMVVLALAACSADAESVSATEVERRVTPVIADRTGSKPTSVECDPLDAEVGATTTCEVAIGEQRLEFKVTAAKVDGDDVDLDIVQV